VASALASLTGSSLLGGGQSPRPAEEMLHAGEGLYRRQLLTQQIAHLL
jgi:hypothetical protein